MTLTGFYLSMTLGLVTYFAATGWWPGVVGYGVSAACLSWLFLQELRR